MQAREFLRQAAAITAGIRAAEARRQAFMRRAAGEPADGEAARAYLQLAEEQTRLARELADWQRQLEEALVRVPDERYRYILRARYLDGWRLAKIARELGYSYDHTARMHGRALQLFAAAWQKDAKP